MSAIQKFLQLIIIVLVLTKALSLKRIKFLSRQSSKASTLRLHGVNYSAKSSPFKWFTRLLK